MQIQNVEALKSWLTTRLEPICDADPAALAKYVVALVKKDKPPEELKHVCKDQLEVFLSEETNHFVEVLFESLASHSYLPPTIVEPIITKPATVSPKEKKDSARKPSISEEFNTSKSVIESSVPDDDERDFRRTRKNTDSNKDSLSDSQEQVDKTNRKRRAEEDHSIGKEQAKIPKEDISKSIDQEADTRRNGDSQPIPSTQASRDSNRDRRYPRRDRDFSPRNEDDERIRRGAGLWIDRRRDRDRDMDRGRPRDRDRHHDVNQRYMHRERKTRCRDYEEKGFCIRGELCPFDHGNDPVVIQDVPMQGMIPGFPSQPPFIPPPIGSMPVVPPLLGVPSETFPRPPNQPPPPVSKPNVSEPSKTDKNTDLPKGTLADTQSVSTIKQPGGGPLPPPVMMMAPMDPGIRPPFMPMPRPPRPPFPLAEDTYNPEQPQFERLPLWMRIGVPRPNVPGPVVPNNPSIPLQQRELVTVSTSQPHLTVQVSTDKPGESNRVVIGPNNGKQTKGEQNNSINKPVWRKYNDTLEIKKIPRELNTITKLNEYFQKFGSIVNIQVNAFSDPEAALITFSKHLEAKAAYTCPDAVLGNRFIRVFWHQPDRNTESTGKPGANTENKTPAKPTMFQSGKTTFVRQAKPSTSDNDTPATDASTMTATATTATTTSSIATSNNVQTTSTSSPLVSIPSASVSSVQPKLQHKQEIMKKKLEIQKQKQELLDKQIKQQKLLISKLDKKNLSLAEKESIMKTLKALSQNIESIKKEFELAAMTAKSKQSPLQARQLAQKAILDQELDLITHQHSGEDTTELRKKVEELKQEAQSLGLLDGPVKGRGISTPRGRGIRGRGRGRGRGHGSRVWTKESGSSDAIIKQISIADVKPTDKDNIVEHFMDFGNVDCVEYDSETSCMILTFRSRKEAEIAFKAKKLKDKVLNLSWYKPPAPTPLPTSTTPTKVITPQLRQSRSSTLSSSKLDDDDLGLDLDGDLGKHDDEEDEALLLGGDFDEEEDDEEDRSWRR